MGKYIRTLTIYYDTEISQREVPLFRGAVLKSLGDKADLLYHNHTGADTFRYSYPLIQYKRLGGKAAIVCVEEGTDIIGQFLTMTPESIALGERMVRPKISKVLPFRTLVQTWTSSFEYRVHRWIPLNAMNYQKYKSLDDPAERLVFLENILAANLLSMLKGLGIHLEDELLVKITDAGAPYIQYNKGIGMMALDAEFLCNLSIPNNVGVGKNVSVGCGVVSRKRPKEKKENE